MSHAMGDVKSRPVSPCRRRSRALTRRCSGEFAPRPAQGFPRCAPASWSDCHVHVCSPCHTFATLAIALFPHQPAHLHQYDYVPLATPSSAHSTSRRSRRARKVQSSGLSRVPLPEANSFFGETCTGPNKHDRSSCKRFCRCKSALCHTRSCASQLVGNDLRTSTFATFASIL